MVGKAEAARDLTGVDLGSLDRHGLRLGLDAGALLAAQAELHALHDEPRHLARGAGDAREIATMQHDIGRTDPVLMRPSFE